MRYAFHVTSIDAPCVTFPTHVGHCVDRASQGGTPSHHAELHTCGVCLTCCTCALCPECQHLETTDLCEMCHLCRQCCKCIQCGACRNIYRTKECFCQICGFGLQCCCLHRRSTHAINYTRHDVFLDRYKCDPGEYPTRRLLSAEIELCGFSTPTKPALDHLNHVLKTWACSVVSDGSLPSGGCEINTHPAAGKYWVDQVTNVLEAAQHATTWVDSHAGCHIHIDCRDLGYAELARVLTVFALVEPALYSLVPPPRQENRYCRAWVINYLQGIWAAEREAEGKTERDRTLAYRKKILEALYGTSETKKIRSTRSNKSHGCRYRAVNLHSFMHRGTIEMRLPAGTIYPENVINWGWVLGAIIDHGVRHNMNTITSKGDKLMNLYQTWFNARILGSDYTYASLSSEIKEASIQYLDQEVELPKSVVDWLHERRKNAKRPNALNEGPIDNEGGV